MVSGPARRALEFARRLVFRCGHDEIVLRASALAFSTVISLVPLLAVIWYLVARTLREQGPATLRMIAELLPYREEAVVEALQSFLEQAEYVSGAALIGFLIVSLMTFLSVQETLSRIFRVLTPPSLWRRLLAFALLFFWGPLLIGSVYGGLLWLGQWNSDADSALGRLLRDSTLIGTLPALATLIGLAMLYWRASLGRIKLRHAFAGSLVATLALELLKVGFRIYAGSFSDVQRAVYGTLAIARSPPDPTSAPGRERGPIPGPRSPCSLCSPSVSAPAGRRSTSSRRRSASASTGCGYASCSPHWSTGATSNRRSPRTTATA